MGGPTPVTIDALFFVLAMMLSGRDLPDVVFDILLKAEGGGL
jgi:hypothetical protein